MKLRYYALIFLLILLSGIAAIFFVLPEPKEQADLVQINDITQTLAENLENLQDPAFILPGMEKMDYAVTDAYGVLLRATRRGLSEDVQTALRRGDIIVDMMRDGQIVGKVIFQNNALMKWQAYRQRLQILSIVILCLCALVSIIFLVGLHRKILRPFSHMRKFARRVAAGELDIPLPMDKKNAFVHIPRALT